MPSPPLQALGYGAVRRRWCARALVAWLKRWAHYLLVLLLLFGAGSNSLVGSVSALAGWTVLPLFWAVAQAPVWLPAVLAAQVLLAAGLVWGMRSLLWPVAWRAAERALPIRPTAQCLSDATVVALGLLPLATLYLAGALAWWQQRPAWLVAVWPWALLALLGLCGASVAAGVVVLQALRRPASSGHRGAVAGLHEGVNAAPTRAAGRGRSPRRALRPLSPGWSLVLLPLFRGTARRTAATAALGLAALLLTACALWRLPGQAGWWLAAWAAAALLISSRLRALITLELAPLAAAAVVLPVAPRHWWRLQGALALAPLALGLPVLLLALPWGQVRPALVAGYVAACVVVCTLEVASRSGPPADKASRWLLSLVLVLALASEVVV